MIAKDRYGQHRATHLRKEVDLSCRCWEVGKWEFSNMRQMHITCIGEYHRDSLRNRLQIDEYGAADCRKVTGCACVGK